MIGELCGLIDTQSVPAVMRERRMIYRWSVMGQSDQHYRDLLSRWAPVCLPYHIGLVQLLVLQAVTFKWRLASAFTLNGNHAKHSEHKTYHFYFWLKYSLKYIVKLICFKILWAINIYFWNIVKLMWKFKNIFWNTVNFYPLLLLCYLSLMLKFQALNFRGQVLPNRKIYLKYFDKIRYLERK